MNVHVNSNCISCGLCVSTCPNVFLITDGGTAGVYSREVPPRPGGTGPGRRRHLPGERH